MLLLRLASCSQSVSEQYSALCAVRAAAASTLTARSRSLRILAPFNHLNAPEREVFFHSHGLPTRRAIWEVLNRTKEAGSINATASRLSASDARGVGRSGSALEPKSNTNNVTTITHMALTTIAESRAANVGKDPGVGPPLFADVLPFPTTRDLGSTKAVDAPLFYMGGGVADLLNRAARRQVWQAMALYGFVAAPVGHGLDTHRTWEALALGCIVLVEVRGSCCELLSGCRTERESPFSCCAPFFEH